MNSKRIIKYMTTFEYALAFNKDRTYLSDRNAQKASKRGRLFCMQENDNYIGFICTAYEYENETITYAYTKEQYRNQGVFTSLVEYIFNTSKKHVQLWILEDHPYYQIVDDCLKKIGCYGAESFHFFTLKNHDSPAWQKLKKENHIEECCQWLKKNDYQVYSFAEADEQILEQVKNSHNSDFKNALNPAVFFEPSSTKPFAEMSFVVVKDNRLVAYTLFFKSTDNGAILEQISTSAETKNSGVIILALFASWDYFFENNYSKCTFGIHPHNIESNSLKRIFENYFQMSEATMKNYIKPK